MFLLLRVFYKPRSTVFILVYTHIKQLNKRQNAYEDQHSLGVVNKHYKKYMYSEIFPGFQYETSHWQLNLRSYKFSVISAE